MIFILTYDLFRISVVVYLNLPPSLLLKWYQYKTDHYHRVNLTHFSSHNGNDHIQHAQLCINSLISRVLIYSAVDSIFVSSTFLPLLYPHSEYKT